MYADASGLVSRFGLDVRAFKLLAFGGASIHGIVEATRIFNLSPSGNLREAAANLFRLLREADRTKPEGIAVSSIPHKGLGEAINDRLRRAAGFVG